MDTGQNRTPPKWFKGGEIAWERTRKNQLLFIEWMSKVGTIWGACEKSGVGRQTVYTWLDNDARFKKEFQDAKRVCVEKVETGLFQDALGRGEAADNVARKMYLAAESPDKYREKREIEHKGKISITEWLDQQDDDGEGDGSDAPPVPEKDS